ncbi:short-chain dehydrogenase/reductase [Amycolatopsis deserti]|uniref:Short-chain dehydrogenase/reductase n=1 Tax=Amycolatopsis deserti TaxID=185696 RepID=A0ABQ3IRE3_9PSEU|nr:SDR family NAD(P)-dependent oxidoreductase [Amycolatopsis deserti]GHE91218.1 short-chain dehydrogenase/reductase [Amycolatopsis deserti]
MRTWFITGASGGLGTAIARQALAAGDAVVATARRPERIGLTGDRLLALPLDVTDENAARSAVARAVDRFGRIDVLVSNAGRGLFGAVEETSPAEARELFDINVFGLLGVTRAVLPVMRAQRGGHVLAISSMGGFSAGAGFGVYAASKFAVEALHEALAEELAPFGVSVTIVEPGVFGTGFGAASAQVAQTIDAYAAPDYADDDGDPPGDPADAAAAIVAVAGTADAPLRLPLGRDAVARIRAKLDQVAGDLGAA